MADTKYFKYKHLPINCVVQAHNLDNIWQGIKKTYVGHRKLHWTGYLSPTPLSAKYLIDLKYEIGKRPKVFVLEPELHKYDDQPIPHRFSDMSLCLFRYKYYEWNSEMLISDTIIPWTLLWIFDYEVWILTGKWYGKGEHAVKKEENG